MLKTNNYFIFLFLNTGIIQTVIKLSLVCVTILTVKGMFIKNNQNSGNSVLGINNPQMYKVHYNNVTSLREECSTKSSSEPFV